MKLWKVPGEVQRKRPSPCACRGPALPGSQSRLDPDVPAVPHALAHVSPLPEMSFPPCVASQDPLPSFKIQLEGSPALCPR